MSFYVSLVSKYGEPGAAGDGFTECATQYGQGKAAMWYDATSTAGTIEAAGTSTVVGKNGYVEAPVMETPHSGWLYSWSLGDPGDLAEQAGRMAVHLVGHLARLTSAWSVEKLGWANLPPGSRLSTYQIPQYQKAAKAFANPTLRAIEEADPYHPTVPPVPYTGIQFLDIPEFQDLGQRVSQQITAAIAGQEPVSSALTTAQEYAVTVGNGYRKR